MEKKESKFRRAIAKGHNLNVFKKAGNLMKNKFGTILINFKTDLPFETQYVK